MRRRRLRIPRRLGLVFKGPRQHVVQFMEGVIAAHFRIADRRLDVVIARDESRIDRPHARAARFRRIVYLGQARTPARCPCIIGGRIAEQRPNFRITAGVSGCLAQRPERRREIRLVFSHAMQEVLDQSLVAIAGAREAKLPAIPAA